MLLLIRKDWFLKIMEISHKQSEIIKFFLTRFPFLGLGISLILNLGGKDSLIAIILGYILGIGIIYIYNKLVNYIDNDSFNKLIKIIFIIYYSLLISIEVIIFVCFIRDFFLPYTNTIISALPFIFLAIYLANKGIVAISQTSKILFIILLGFFFLTFVTLISSVHLDNFLPILTIKKISLFKASLSFAVLSTAPYFIMIKEKAPFKSDLKVYSLGCLSIFLSVFVILGIFGGNLVKVFSYPEYTVLRQIKALGFLENIENFVVLSWFFDIFITLTTLFYKLKKNINIKNNYALYFISLIILLIINHFVINNYIAIDYIFKYIVYILLGFILVLIILLFIKSNEKYKQPL